MNTKVTVSAEMDREVADRLKLAAALKGVSVSAFIREASIEKMDALGIPQPTSIPWKGGHYDQADQIIA